MKIKFSKLTSKDLRKVMKWRMLQEVKRYMFSEPNLTYYKQKKWFKKIKNDKSKKYWIVKVNDRDIGLVSLTNIDYKNKKAERGYYIGETLQRGKGLGKQIEINLNDYVFIQMKFNKLFGYIFKFNKRMISIHNKFGSKIEGELKRHILKNNKYEDIIIMSVFKNDWIYIRKKYFKVKAIIE